MSNNKKTEKKPTIAVLAKEAVLKEYKNNDKELLLLVPGKIEKAKGSYIFISFDKVGFSVFQYTPEGLGKESHLIHMESHDWQKWNSVLVDQFTLKTKFNFSGQFNDFEFTAFEKGNEVLKILSSHAAHINIEKTSRKWWQKLVGYRSQKKWKMITASITYFIILMFFVGLFTDENEADEQPIKQAKSQVVTSDIPSAESKKVDNEKKANEEEKKLEIDKQKKDEENLNFKGTVSSKVVDKKITVSINANVPDGGVFEVFVLNDELKTLSDYITIKDGKIEKVFDIPEDWGVGHISTSALFRFNLDEHPQPDTIKSYYGEKGEKLTGSLVTDNNQGGKSASLETHIIAYPSEEAVAKKVDESFNAAIDEIISVGEGIILSISPRYDNWEIVNIIISDDWYYSPEHEKERFVEQVGGAVENIILSSEKASGSVNVYFVDTFGKDLATPKMFGGYKIKN